MYENNDFNQMLVFLIIYVLKKNTDYIIISKSDSVSTDIKIDLYYSDTNKVWCKIKLSSTSLPLYVINDYINDNKFLYDGWYFEISPEQGHILRDFRLL